MGQEIYIALGSNLGNRKAHLQTAIETIAKRIGKIVKVSSVYETPALGFEGAPFYNACVFVHTELSAEKALDLLLQIETELGRIRNKTEGYRSRPIDLDILLFGNEIHESQKLVIPHPEMQNRKFVLAPLAEIAPDKKHPINKVTITELLSHCPDKSDISKTDEHLDLLGLVSPFANYNYIAIEGNIGAGKTTLATKISEDFNAKLILERYADNPFLPKFYENPKRYGFTLEMSFLTERYQQMAGHLEQLDLFKQLIVSDYDIFKSLIFAGVTLNKDEFSLYRKLFYLLYNQIVKPELYIYLYQNTDRLIDNIHKRGRDYEKNISKDYLNQIQEGYLQFIQSNPNTNTLVIDVTDLDFVENPNDYDKILLQIHQYIK